jgi:hypothetical protein
MVKISEGASLFQPCWGDGDCIVESGVEKCKVFLHLLSDKFTLSSCFFDFSNQQFLKIVDSIVFNALGSLNAYIII